MTSIRLTCALAAEISMVAVEPVLCKGWSALDIHTNRPRKFGGTDHIAKSIPSVIVAASIARKRSQNERARLDEAVVGPACMLQGVTDVQPANDEDVNSNVMEHGEKEREHSRCKECVAVY